MSKQYINRSGLKPDRYYGSRATASCSVIIITTASVVTDVCGIFSMCRPLTLHAAEFQFQKEEKKCLFQKGIQLFSKKKKIFSPPHEKV